MDAEILSGLISSGPLAMVLAYGIKVLWAANKEQAAELKVARSEKDEVYKEQVELLKDLAKHMGGSGESE